MASEGTVAPKERVNIVYKPSTGDAQAEVELPLKLLVMGDFTLRQEEASVEDRKSININKDNFNDVLKGQNISLNLAVNNRLEEGKKDEQLAVKLGFESLRDFEPDAIVQKVPELKNLIQLREALKALKGPLGNVPAFRKQLQDLVADSGVRQKLLDELGIKE